MSSLGALLIAFGTFLQVHIASFSFQNAVTEAAQEPHQTAYLQPIKEKDPDHRISIPNNLTARAILIAHLDSGAVIADRFGGDALPIASITKVMTGLVALEHLAPDSPITISKEALTTQGMAGDFVAGETFKLKDLLAAMMMYSSNDAAMAVAEAVGAKLGGVSFEEKISRTVNLMNSRAKELGMHETIFFDPVGLDLNKTTPGNQASASDLLLLVKETLKSAPLLFELSRESAKTIYAQTGTSHSIYNTNELARRIPHFVGGKTGSTDIARDCLILIYEYPLGHREILILLGASPGQRFKEASSLVEQIVPLL